MIPLLSPDHVDLSQHAVIEASAGTGKTHTITHLVMRLLLEDRIPLTQILLVTFTDKATNELRTRIRELIDASIQTLNDPEQSRLLVQARLDVNQAPIFTINAFCQHMLREYAFEQGGAFDFDLVNDRTMYQQALLQMKREWPADPKWRHRIAKLKQPGNQPDELLMKLNNAVTDPLSQLRPKPMSPSTLYARLQSLLSSEFKVILNAEFDALSGPKKPTKDKHRATWEAWLDSLQSASQEMLLSVLTDEVKLFYQKGIGTAFNNNHIEKNRHNAPHFMQLKAWFDDLVMADLGQNTTTWIELIQAMRSRADTTKLNQGLISYDDMINRLAHQLEAERARPEFEQIMTRRLRQKFQVAMIDEFQDTSWAQWSIFQQVFLAGQSVHRLLVIGDPKQAIYGFRGADVATYQQAVDTMLNNHEARGYRLESNYRSLPQLLTELNRFFGDEMLPEAAWWDDSTVAVNAAPKAFIAQHGPAIERDDSGTGPINAIQVPGTGLKIDALKQNMAEQMAGIIQQQLLSQVEYRHKGRKHTLQADDVCILIHKADDAKPLEEALSALGIAHHHHKKHSLYLSNEALQFEAVLTALAEPQNRRRLNNALITVFFGLKPEQLEMFAEERLPDVSEQWLQVKAAAADNDWVRAFEVLMHHSNGMGRVQTDRAESNFNQIKNELCTMALSHNWDAHSLLQWLLEKRSAEADHREDLQVRATQSGAVNIMTMHVSKGLEFPVVFLFGGYTQTQKRLNQFSKYRCPSTGQLVCDLDRDGTWDRHLAHEQEERKRLYYVAMTRAVFKLFLPMSSNDQHNHFNRSHYGALINKRLEQLIAAGMMPVISAADSSTVDHKINPPEQGAIKLQRAPDQIPMNLPTRNRRLYSFSGLSHRFQHGANLDASLGEATEKMLNQADFETPSMQPVDWQRELPGGIKTGHVLHGIFEHVDFQWFLQTKTIESAWNHPDIMAVVDEQMQQHRLDNGHLLNAQGEPGRTYRCELAAWVWHTLRKPLKALDGGVLASLKPADKRHEMAFFWQQDQVNLTGFIDLLFQVKRGENTDYYILDWKSNHSQTGYAPAVLADQVMASHQYHWQYELYAMAVQRWFDALGLKNARLAGALYLFSRGIDCLSEGDHGVYFNDFSVSEFKAESVAAHLLKLVGGAHAL